MFAAKADDADCVNLVCKAGARLENTCKEVLRRCCPSLNSAACLHTCTVTAQFGATAFLLACENGCSKSLTALINKGCSMTAKDVRVSHPPNLRLVIHDRCGALMRDRTTAAAAGNWPETRTRLTTKFWRS